MLNDETFDFFHADTACRTRLAKDSRFDLGLETCRNMMIAAGTKVEGVLTYDAMHDVLIFTHDFQHMKFRMRPLKESDVIDDLMGTTTIVPQFEYIKGTRGQ